MKIQREKPQDIKAYIYRYVIINMKYKILPLDRPQTKHFFFNKYVNAFFIFSSLLFTINHAIT